jgi:hypothetical protein
VWFLPLYSTPSFPVFLTALLLLRLLALVENVQSP